MGREKMRKGVRSFLRRVVWAPLWDLFKGSGKSELGNFYSSSSPKDSFSLFLFLHCFLYRVHLCRNSATKQEQEQKSPTVKERRSSDFVLSFLH